MNRKYIDEIDRIERENEVDEVMSNFDEIDVNNEILRDEILDDNFPEKVTISHILIWPSYHFLPFFHPLTL